MLYCQLLVSTVVSWYTFYIPVRERVSHYFNTHVYIYIQWEICNVDTETDESVLFSDMSSFQEWYILGAGNLFRKVSSVQRCLYRERFHSVSGERLMVEHSVLN